MDYSNLDPAIASALQAKLAATAWSRGKLEYKFHATQQAISEAISRSTRKQFFLLCSRRTGKSYMLLARLFQRAIQQPGARLLFLAPHGKAAREIAHDLSVKLLEDCPDHLKPTFNGTLNEWTFKHVGAPDSIVRLKGVNGEHYQDLRGGAQDEIVLDECGQMDNLKKIVEDVCLPMTLTTKGRILFATTPPTSTGHDSVTIFEKLAGHNSAVKFTILDSPHVSYEEKREMILEYGEKETDVDAILAGTLAPKTTSVQREYFCEFVTDASLAVVPEYDAQARKEIFIPWERPEYYTPYVSMDPGVKDRTGILFAYWDFLKAKLVIEDELLLDHPGTPDIAREIKAKELELYKGRWEPTRVLDAAGDGGLRLIADLRNLHELTFRPARKDDRLAAIALTRQSVQSRELIINPNCKHLNRQLRDAIWNNKGTEMLRAGTNSIDGHYDLVAALIYLCRSIDRLKNPYPPGFYARGGRFGPGMDQFVSVRPKKTSEHDIMGDTPLARKLKGSG